jgi:hypothetical protein
MADSRRCRLVGTDSGFSVAAWLKTVRSTAFHGSADVLSYGWNPRISSHWGEEGCFCSFLFPECLDLEAKGSFLSGRW